MRRMIIPALLLSGTIAIGPAAAQDLVGVVTDQPAMGGRPLDYEEVTICPRGDAEGGTGECVEAYTGSDGSFTVMNLPPGDYDLAIPGTNYELSLPPDMAPSPQVMTLAPPAPGGPQVVWQYHSR